MTPGARPDYGHDDGRLVWVSKGIGRGRVARRRAGCPSNDKDTDTTTGNTTSTDGTAGDTSGGSTGAGSSGDTPTGSGTGSATEAGTSEAGTTDATTGEATTGGSTGGLEIPPVCQSYGAKVAECYNPRQGAMAEQYCAIARIAYEMYGADCVKAFEDFTACLSALNCEELTGQNPVCETESAALEAACVMP